MNKQYVKTFEQFVSAKFTKVNEDANQAVTNDQLQQMIADWNKTWGDKITFSQGKWSLDLTDATKQALTALADLMKQHQTIKFDIVGHTNSDPVSADLGDGVTDNKKLSEKRAQAVKDFLTKNIPDITSRVSNVIGAGESELLDANYTVTTDKTKEDKDKSRRVEIKVTGFVEDKPKEEPVATVKPGNNVQDILKAYLSTINPTIENAMKVFADKSKNGPVVSNKDGKTLDLVTFAQRYVPGQSDVIRNDMKANKYTYDQLKTYIKSYIDTKQNN